ncbi:coenzyme Q biosynthesis protein [Tieghemostelium lacteum]|uniref:Ubiquinone biosynthesis protein COQ4 homolog, mitochondrial n=1 Tax=Tieghemostelium lacteum TaxID=361077 RepID=A0A151ZHJ4_TIELA|nr:coenzyme Q biosynthesis protein [Tieghemostelium lacteum]|eukprot:KYQ93334.1 coenzyme Q biosynthesis protein [Tieghemostelium lacteum]
MLPNVIIIEILEHILNSFVKIESLPYFVDRFSLVSKKWNREILPKLRKSDHIYLGGKEDILFTQLQRIAKSGIQYTLKIRLSEPDVDVFYPLIKDNVKTLICDSLTNREIRSYPNLELIDISVYNPGTGIEEIDKEYIFDNNIKMDIFYCHSDSNDPVTQAVLHAPNVQTIFLMCGNFEFKFLNGCQSYATITSFTIYATTLQRLDYITVILENLVMATTIDIDDINFIETDSEMLNKIACKVSTANISKTIENLTLVYKESCHISNSSILNLFAKLPKLQKLSIKITTLIIDYTDPVKSKNFRQLDLVFREIVKTDSTLFLLNSYSQLTAKSLVLSSQLLLDIPNNFWETPLFTKIESLIIESISDKSLSSDTVNIVVSKLPIKSLAFSGIENKYHTFPIQWDSLKLSLLKNKDLTSIHFGTMEVQSCSDLLLLKIPNLKEIIINNLRMDIGSPFLTLVNCLKFHETLEKFHAIQSSYTGYSQLNTVIDILQNNYKLTELILPFAKFKDSDLIIKQQLPILNKILKTNTNISLLNFSDKNIHNNLFQKVLLTCGSALIGFVNPHRTDMIATLGEVTGECAVKSMKNKMMLDPIGREILKDKPRIRQSTFPQNLHLLPKNTFGGAYYQFMNSHGYSADDRQEVRMIEDPDDAYVMQRYREVHDFWHVLAGIETDVQGELAVKWLEMIQTGLPMTAMSSIVGPLRCTWSEQMELYNHMIPWAIKTGRNCKNLMNVRYEDHWEQNLDDFRNYLNFQPYQYQNKKTN